MRDFASPAPFGFGAARAFCTTIAIGTNPLADLPERVRVERSLAAPSSLTLVGTQRARESVRKMVSEMNATTDELDPATRAVPTLSVQETMRRHHESLLRFLRQQLRLEDAADVAQEAYVRLMQYEGSGAIRSPSSMLFRIAINVTHDLSRAERLRKDRKVPFETDELACDRPGPDREIQAQQELALVCEAIERLPPKCRRVFLLSRAHSMTYAQVAARCGISVKMVEKHISHALRVCTEVLARANARERIGAGAERA